MKTQCTPALPPFQLLKRRAVQVQFDGGFISSEGGALLLRELEQRTGILSRVSGCFTDYRNPDLIEHPVEALIKQRIYGVALGYEDLDDH
ncbi:MAG TPA: transposase, partial [Thiolinea sp.]|nr:transposase [Thiolinea sp.]